jgi:hypothetical protein
MVIVKDFKTVTKENGEAFSLLIVQGGVEPVKSQRTGRIYFTVRTAKVPTTFDEATCKSVLGTTFDGEIKKVACDPYKFVITETGEEIEMQHRWEYVDENLDLMQAHVVSTTEAIK